MDCHFGYDALHLFKLRLPSAQKECGQEYTCDAYDNKGTRYALGRLQGVYIKVKKDGGNLYGYLLHRNDIACLRKFKGFIRLPDTKNVAPYKNRAG